MGIVQRQTIKSSVYSYTGAILGFVTTGILLPQLCTTEQNGLLIMLVQLSVLGAQIFSLGTTSISVKFFPYFRNTEKGHNGILYLLLMLSTIGSLLAVVVYFVGKDFFVDAFIEKSPLLVEYLYLLIPLSIFTIYFNTIDAYTRGLFNASTGILIKEFIQRLIILLFIGMLFLHLIRFEQFLYLYVIAICIPALLIIMYLVYKKSFHVSKASKPLPKRLSKYMFTFGSYSLLTGFASLLVNTIDNTMITKIMGLSDTGIYGRAFIFGTLIAIPGRSMNRVSSALISEAWKRKDIAYISDFYRRSCLTQLIVGCFLFLGVWGNIGNIMHILPGEYASGKYVIFYIALMSLFDMATGANGIIITSSRYYRFEFFSMLMLIFLCFVTNWLLIPLYGIVGAAIATAVTIFIFNLARVIFLYIRFRMFPYNMQNLKIVLVTLITLGIASVIPQMDNFIIDIIIRSAVITFVFGLLIYFLRISADINSRIDHVLSTLKKQ